MAYGIIYNSQKQEETRKHRARRACLTVVFIFVFLFLVSACWPSGMTLLQELVRPVRMDTTIQAAEVFAMELNSGYSLPDALENFADTIQKNGYGN